MTCPCKNCEKQGCGPFHDQCERYQEYVHKMRREKEYQKEMKERSRKDRRGPRNYW